MTRLRRAGPDDAEALSELKQATYRETFVDGFAIPYDAEDLTAFFAANYSPAAVRRELDDPRSATWVVERDGRRIGYARVAPCKLPHPDATPEQGELCQLYLLGEAQGQGWGGRLMTAALDHLTAHFPGPIWLGVWSGNHKAQAIYRRLGFEWVGDYEFIVGQARDREHIMRRPRAAP